MPYNTLRASRNLRFAFILLLPVVALAAATLCAVPMPQAHNAQAKTMASTQAGLITLAENWEKTYDLPAGRTVEISVHLEKPSALPANGRVAVEWTLDPKNAIWPEVPDLDNARRNLGIPVRPTANWRKVLHALDSDVYLVYRAPVAGRYTLRLHPVTEEEPLGEEAPRWREKGSVTVLTPLPRTTPWPSGTVAPVAIAVRPVALGDRAEQDRLRTIVACEPNDTPELAQPITLTSGDGNSVRTWEITGGADDIEFFDNGRVGKSGDDWFRLEYKGTEPRLLTAQLSMPGQAVAARIRAYTNNGHLAEYKAGQDPNERVHQQDEEHRTNICRLIKPGGVYFLRVEANAPGYQLELRVLKPAPYDDPRMAIRQGVYTQIGQVDAWLTNRPRGASLERRIRETGNLLGAQCMSCHTQSGVWGPAGPFAQGYRPENVQNYWHLVNVMYECLRPCNQLVDAANNTSLAPLDIGDGPAGTRVAGFNIVNLERYLKPLRLHSKQQIRTANYVLQTGDPSSINAAGPGSNVGFVIVNVMATEILKTAWENTGDSKYFRVMQQKARQVLEVNPQFTDDVALRLYYFYRVLPIELYAKWVQKAMKQETAQGLKAAGDASQEAFIAKVKAQRTQDEARLRATQNADGSWGFSPGSTNDGGKTWQSANAASDPSPTALGILGLTAAGYGKDDPAIARGVKRLLAMQEPTGRWNLAAQTGFVTTAYALHALSRLYPVTPPVFRRADFAPTPNETLLATIKRVQTMALTGDAQFADLLVQAAQHDSPLVRYWAMIGLGATHTEAGVPFLIRSLGDHAEFVRDAATWGMRQTLLDDKGWEAVFTAYAQGDDTTRAQVMQTIGMRADAVLSRAHANWSRLNALFTKALNEDANPAVRAWAMKAAWQWWIWNPPVRNAINTAWVTLLERPEPNALVENCLRYSSQMLFIANGHKANGSNEQQYKELAALFDTLSKRLDTANAETKKRLARRLVGIGATYYELGGGDGGPGQMGYVTPGAGEMMGKAALLYLESATQGAELAAMKAGLEGSANVPYQPLTRFLVDYSLHGPDALRQIAAAAISDPRSVSLPAVPEQVDPQMAQILRGAMEPPRRPQISDPILDLWARVNWIVPKREEQQRLFFNIVIPRFDHYVAPEDLAKMTDPARRVEAERDMDAAWYLADRLGDVLERNPDLHQEIVFRHYFPAKFDNPLQEHFWIRSVDWLLTFDGGGEQAGVKKSAFTPDTPQTAPDETLTIRDRALQLYLDALKPSANPKIRAIAIRKANETALRTNPEVLRALAEAQKFERDPELRSLLTNVLSQSDANFLPELRDALLREKNPAVHFDANGVPVLTPEQKENILYFRDYVLPELTRQKRSDQQSCMGCHGLIGRVPSFYMRPPDKFGYLPVADLLFDYRVLQTKVNLTNLEKSKILRKPLNVQDGKEDGHQGGRRYAPDDPGYLMLKKWVAQQPKVQ